MNNEWLNNLRSRMDDHEEDVPEGLWDDIKDELFSGEQDSAILGLITEIQEDIAIKEKETYAGKKSLFYRIAGIAAAIVLLFLLIKLIPQEVSEKRISQKSPAVEIGKERNSLKPIKTGDHSSGELKSERDAFLADNILNTGSAEKIAAQRYAESRSENQAEKSQKIQNVFKLPEAAESFQQESRIAYNIPSVDDTAKENDKEKASDEVIFKQENPKEIYAENTKRNTAKSRNKKSWMLSMLTGNIASNSAEQQFPGYASITGKAMSVEQVFTTSEYHDDPLTAILLANQSQPVEARIRHKVPVTFGLSLYYNLGKRWGIGTGLNYTKLSSELHSGSDNNYIKGDQTIHYIGLPVQVNYNVIRKGRFTGYITGGALVEKPISGSVTTSYIVNDEVKESSKERLDHKPFQFSVNAAAGLQLKIVDKIGVYAEPGIGYHFKEENAPNTIYKEKPLHFNMKFGIRVLLD
ncbi:porin family protein [Chryseobacterium culicis]|uniref:Outer membrane protein beta-barrel domain-containing protein n=1 Tax=Chryseobacterium culicis TaxID=680127 RepID=A0A1H6HMZ2_CHRCI|nr:porin family protein [Chryseobacterium culicis]SEH35343.1 Outer membrane protein beta-barrel domain-containing protein [Chryseobacterium culicis]